MRDDQELRLWAVGALKDETSREKAILELSKSELELLKTAKEPN